MGQNIYTGNITNANESRETRENSTKY